MITNDNSSEINIELSPSHKRHNSPWSFVPSDQGEKSLLFPAALSFQAWMFPLLLASASGYTFTRYDRAALRTPMINKNLTI